MTVYLTIVGDRTDPEAPYQTVGVFLTEQEAADYAAELNADWPPPNRKKTEAAHRNQ